MVAIIRRDPTRALTVVEPVHYHPWSLLDEFDFDMLAQDFGDGWRPSALRTGLSPRIDMYEVKDDLIIRAELPGFKKEDVDISLEGDCLTIKGEKKSEDIPEDAVYYTCERCFGRYSRSVTLPFPVDTDKVSASFDNGVLQIKLPKAEEAKTKHVSISVS